jgi:RNA polymerase sigma factor (sigma-70 family)
MSRVAEEHAELVLAAKLDRGCRGELIDAFCPLIASMARVYIHPGTLERQELMQQGIVGLLEALERYDPDFGTPFWAYACWWVRQAMQQMVSQLSGPVVLADRAQRALSRVGVARHSYSQEHRREPTRSELAVATRLEASHIESLMAARGWSRALDEPVGDADGGFCLGDMLADPTAEEAFDGVPDRAAAEGLGALLAELDERERYVVRGHFGLDGEERTLRELAGHLGVSAERVRQIEQRALDTMRAVVM